MICEYIAKICLKTSIKRVNFTNLRVFLQTTKFAIDLQLLTKKTYKKVFVSGLGKTTPKLEAPSLNIIYMFDAPVRYYVAYPL